MERKTIITRDGSASISIPDMNVTYHSIHGALQESKHVFIDAGLQYVLRRDPGEIRILEMGMGTGLNVLLTGMESENIGTVINYTALELFPLTESELTTLNYSELLTQPQLQNLFQLIHRSRWDEEINLNTNFLFNKIKGDLKSIELAGFYDLIYFDAFAPTAQPELWTVEIFKKLFDVSRHQGILVTYCSKSVVQKAMRGAGWTVEKIPGPHGKREMLRATANKESGN